MKITGVSLRNYRGHRQLDLTLDGSLIGLTGKNGSGKSRLITAIRDTLTGDFPPTKEACISWGAKSATLEVAVLLDDGRRMLVHRELPKGTSWLQFNDDKENRITTPSKVNAAVLEALNTDKSILTNIVFVGQKDIESLLFDRTGIKDRLAQRFFGLDKAAVLEKSIGAELARITFDSAEQQIPALEKELAGHREKMNAEASRLSSFGAVVEDAVVNDVEARWRAAVEFSSRESGLRALELASAELGSRIASQRSELERQSAEVAKIDTVTLNRLYQEHLQARQTISQRSSLEARIGEAQRLVDQAGPEPITESDLGLMYQDLARAAAYAETQDGQLSKQRQALHEMEKTRSCSQCTQCVEPAHLEKFGADLARAEEELRQFKSGTLHPKQMEYSRVSNERSQWRLRIGNGRESVATLQAQLMALPPMPAFVPNPEGYLAAIQKVTEFQASLTALSKQIADAEKALAENTAAQTAIRQTSTGAVNTDNPALLIRELEGLRARQSAQAQCLAEIRHLESLTGRVWDQLKAAQAAAAENRINREYQRSLTRLREIFHPDGAPKVLVTRTVKRLEDGVNNYLAMLNTPFRARARDGLEFDYLFEHGVGSEDDLSVGQQVDMAWSFRLAAMQTLGSSVGLMTMDEPTAPLDAETVMHFHRLLDHLRQVASSGNFQFIVATHHKELVAFCDQHVQL